MKESSIASRNTLMKIIKLHYNVKAQYKELQHYL